MQAQEGKVYANIINNKVAWIFTKNDMSAWNENDLLVVEIPQDLLSLVKVGSEYKDSNFIFEKLIPCNDNAMYAMLDNEDKLLFFFTKQTKPFYKQSDNVVEVSENELLEAQSGDTYDKKKQSFNLDLEYVRKLYMDRVNSSYESVIQAITGENTPLSEMISWETQEKEAKAYLESNDISQASNIALMAQTQDRDLSEFSNKIIEKAAKYRLASSFLIGYRQKIIRDLENAQDLESIRNATFDMELIQSKLQSM